MNIVELNIDDMLDLASRGLKMTAPVIARFAAGAADEILNIADCVGRVSAHCLGQWDAVGSRHCRRNSNGQRKRECECLANDSSHIESRSHEIPGDNFGRLVFHVNPFPRMAVCWCCPQRELSELKLTAMSVTESQL